MDVYSDIIYDSQKAETAALTLHPGLQEGQKQWFPE